MFNRRTPITTPSTVAEVENTLQELTKGLKNQPLTHVVQSASDLPFSAPGDISGVYWRGAVYFVADNLGSLVDGGKVTPHHILSGLDAVLRHIHAINPLVQKLAAEWVAKNQDMAAEWKKNYRMTDDAAQKRMEDWNSKNPDMPVVISAQQLRSKAMTLMTPQDARLIKGAPKEMRENVSRGLGN